MSNSTTILPNAPACDKNSAPILDVLNRFINEKHQSLLEIGSGSGQHAAYFCKHFPWLSWQTSDLLENHSGINLWKERSNHVNFLPPIEFKIGQDPFPAKHYDIIFTANTLHIISWKQVKLLIKMLGKNIKSKSLIIIYGPFNYHGGFTSDSNKHFDQFLKSKDLKSGIRHFEDITNNMTKNGIYLLEDIAMPANNRTLVFEKG